MNGFYQPQYDPMQSFALANKVNPFMNAHANLSLASNLPGYGLNSRQAGKNTGAFLRGEVPQDVLTLLQQQGAERGIATGVLPGSMNNNAAYLRALGLTSLGMMQQGDQMLSAGVERTPVPQLFNPASLAVPMITSQEELRAAQAGRRRSNAGTSTFTNNGPAFSTFHGGTTLPRWEV